MTSIKLFSRCVFFPSFLLSAESSLSGSFVVAVVVVDFLLSPSLLPRRQQIPKVGTKCKAMRIPMISVPEMSGAINPHSGQSARINVK